MRMQVIPGCVALGLSLLCTVPAAAQAPDPFNQPGNILICDQFNNRVIELDRHHNIVWQFGSPQGTTAGATTIIAPNDAERVGDLTLMSGTGAPPGAEAGFPNGIQDNRVLLVNQGGDIVWQYGQAGIAGSGPNQLNAPVCSVYLPSRHILITDQGNQRVIEVNMAGRIVWQYGVTGRHGAGPGLLNNPNSAELLANGDILIADENNNRVIEVTRAKQIVWKYGNPSDTTILNGAAFASRLDNGHTLITDALNNRIVEVDANGNVVFTYSTSSRPHSVAQPNPTRAVRLYNGDTLISDQFNQQVIELNSAGKLVFVEGVIGKAGSGPGLL